MLYWQKVWFWPPIFKLLITHIYKIKISKFKSLDYKKALLIFTACWTRGRRYNPYSPQINNLTFFGTICLGTPIESLLRFSCNLKLSFTYDINWMNGLKGNHKRTLQLKDWISLGANSLKTMNYLIGMDLVCRSEWSWWNGEKKTGNSWIGMNLVCWGQSKQADQMARRKHGTHGSECTCWAGVSQNGVDQMVRRKQGTHGSEYTWCAGASRNGAGHFVRTGHPPTANPNS